MLVRNHMTKNPITVGPDDDVHQVRYKMLKGNFRRLPVVADGKLVGIVTDRDIRPYLESAGCKPVKEIMTRDPQTISPDDTLERAAQILLDRKIGGLPVVENGKLVGIVTTSDVLEAFLEVMGVNVEQTARIDMLLDQETLDLAGACRIISQEGSEVLGLGTYREKWGESPIFYLRLRSTNPDHLAELLRKLGYKVLGVRP
ncbi:MAG TPA: CBS and ACT domain-containing protein [Candidatus Acidoferrales bacterium]|nr:CBS and ACT domain-containing protein [Candidatus Acidoferrales bacterium]